VIIDCHCHAGTGDGLTGPWDTRADLDRYRDRADAAGITHTVLFAAFHSDYQVANREVAGIVAAEPARFTGFAFVHAERDRGRIGSMVAEAVLRHGFRGIKVHGHDARISREVCEVARRWRLPVLYDPVGELPVLDMVATEYPDVPFVVPHLSSFADSWRAQRGFVDQLARLPNLHADTSGVRYHDLLEEAVRRAGPRRVLFGSDGPWLHPGVELAKVRALGLPPAAERLVLGGNLRRLLARVRTGRTIGTTRTGRTTRTAVAS
jgi:predicted TIM-barrel fold metal-dependent hydrolase